MRRAVSAFMFIFCAFFTFSQDARIAVIDFEIQSDNPDYKYLGKGFAEFVAIDLAKSKEIVLVERERRNSVLEEQEFALSEMADSQKQMAIGRMLAASYLIMGSIYDLAGKLTITVELVDTESAAIVFTDRVSGEVAEYDSLSTSIAGLVLNHFQATIPKSAAPKTIVTKEKSTEVAIKFSNAVDAYDRDDLAAAKDQLDAARRLDPQSEAVRIYLNKLVLNTSKFKAISEQFYPFKNPAFLGIIPYDQFYFNYGTANPQDSTTWYKNYDLEAEEQDNRIKAGYEIPLFEKGGLAVEFMHFGMTDRVSPPDEDAENSTRRSGIGGIISFGLAPSEHFAFGASMTLHRKYLHMFYSSEPRWGASTLEFEEEPAASFSACAGFLFKNFDSSLIFDILAGYSLEKYFELDPDDGTKGDEVKSPVFIENTLNLAVADKRAFVVLKQTNDICHDRSYYVARLIPAFEYWFFPWFSVRAAVEGSLSRIDGDSDWGFGWMPGLTFRIPGIGLDIDGNLTYRQRPARIVGGEITKELIITVGVSKNRLFVTR